MPSASSARIGWHSPNRAMPGLPGAACSSPQRRCLRELPRQCVLTTARPDEENAHRASLVRSRACPAAPGGSATRIVPPWTSPDSSAGSTPTSRRGGRTTRPRSASSSATTSSTATTPGTNRSAGATRSSRTGSPTATSRARGPPSTARGSSRATTPSPSASRATSARTGQPSTASTTTSSSAASTARDAAVSSPSSSSRRERLSGSTRAGREARHAGPERPESRAPMRARLPRASSHRPPVASRRRSRRRRTRGARRRQPVRRSVSVARPVDLERDVLSTGVPRSGACRRLDASGSVVVREPSPARTPFGGERRRRERSPCCLPIARRSSSERSALGDVDAS